MILNKVSNCYSINHLQNSVRTFLTPNPKDPKRKFEVAMHLKQMSQYGLLVANKIELDSVLHLVLQLATQKLFEGHLQTEYWTPYTTP